MTAPDAALRLIGTQTTGRGVVAHVYEPSGVPQYGAVAPEHEGDVVTDPASRRA
jgi:hypothetical protein